MEDHKSENPLEEGPLPRADSLNEIRYFMSFPLSYSGTLTQCFLVLKVERWSEVLEE